MSEGVKHDQGKPPLALLPSTALLGAARAFGHGTRKYTPHNWRRGIAFSRLISAAWRHLAAFNDGVDVDSESGLHHLDHALANLMMLRTLVETRPDCDDRWRPENTPKNTR